MTDDEIETDDGLDPVQRAFHDALMREVPMDRLLKAWTPRMAEREGWGLFESDLRGWEIAADSDSERFVRDGDAHDDEAEAFVRQRAAAGSLYHMLALAIHERELARHKSAAQTQGYVVLELAGLGFQVYRSNGRTEGPRLTDKDGEPFRFPTEAAAWTSAYMDLGDRLDGDE